MTAKVILATPMYGGMCHAAFVSSVIDLMRVPGLQVAHRFMISESLICRGRNRLCKAFLDVPDATHLLFVDADIAFDPQDVVKMLASGKPLVGCPYAMKQYDWQAMASTASAGGDVTSDTLRRAGTRAVLNIVDDAPADVGEFVRVHEMGTGLLLIAREVLERMMEAWPNDFAVDDMPSSINARYHVFFRAGLQLDGHRYLSEDYFLCDRWRQLGGEVWALRTAKTAHYGMHAFCVV